MNEATREQLRNTLPPFALQLARDLRWQLCARRTRAATRRLLARGGEVRLEIGSGAVAGRDGWTTLDLVAGADLYWDLRHPLPFPDASLAAVYSAHVLEHFAYRDLMALLRDCHRALRPGGRIDACVPNGGIYLRAYANPAGFDRRFLSFAPAVISDLPIDIVNYMAYMNTEHRHLFDETNLTRVLEQAGFVRAQLRPWDPRRDPAGRDHESLCAFAFKP